MDVLTKYEHTPVLVAGTLRYTISQWDDGRLVRCRGSGGGVVQQWRPCDLLPCSKALVPKRGSLPRAADLCLWTAALQAAAVLGEIAAVDPAEYERQQNASGEKAGVRSVAAFVKEMAAQLPRCVEDMGAGCVGNVALRVACLGQAFMQPGQLVTIIIPVGFVMQADGAPDCAAAATPGRQGVLAALGHRARHWLAAAQGI